MSDIDWEGELECDDPNVERIEFLTNKAVGQYPILCNMIFTGGQDGDSAFFSELGESANLRQWDIRNKPKDPVQVERERILKALGELQHYVVTVGCGDSRASINALQKIEVVAVVINEAQDD